MITSQEYLNKNEISLKDFLSVFIEKLNFCESERLKQEGYTNNCFFNSDGSLTKQQKITLKEKKKYFYIDFGTSGAFMVLKEDIKTKYYKFKKGNVFNIKAYGTPNFNKCYGLIYNLLPKTLHNLRHDYRR